MRNTGLIVLVLAVVITAAVSDKPQVLTLKDGREFTGVITKTTTGYQIKMKFSVLIFAKDQVASITDVVKPEDEYKRRLKAINANDPRAHLSLAQWAYKARLVDTAYRVRMLKIAKKELETALKLDKELEMAKLLLRRVKADLQRTTRPAETQITTEPNNVGDGKILEEWLVSLEDIYRIRIAEFKVEKDGEGRVDASAAVMFRKNVLKRFIAMMQGQSEDFDARKFQGMSLFNKLKTILTETEEESILKDVVLKRDPWVMREFRGAIWRIVVSRCGTLTCHGAPKGQGKFKLLNVGARNERIDYSNFLILSQYAKGQGRMLDRDNISESLLLHYGLPLDDEKVKYKHPRKKKLNPPPYASVTNGNYLRIQKWIGSLRGPPYGGNYDVKYQAPFGPAPQAPLKLDLDGSTTRPAGN